MGCANTEALKKYYDQIERDEAVLRRADEIVDGRMTRLDDVLEAWQDLLDTEGLSTAGHDVARFIMRQDREAAAAELFQYLEGKLRDAMHPAAVREAEAGEELDCPDAEDHFDED